MPYKLESTDLAALLNEDSWLAIDAFKRILGQVEQTDTSQMEMTIAALEVIDQSSLSSRQMDQLVRGILGAVLLDGANLNALVLRASCFGACVRNAIASTVPASHKQVVYSVGGPPPPVLASAPSAVVEGTTGGMLDVPAVLLIGNRNADMESNSHILRKSGFEPVVLSNLDQLLHDSYPGVCGMVISKEIWETSAPNTHRHAIERVFEFSSFASLFINRMGLHDDVSHELTAIARDKRFNTPTADELYEATSDRLTEQDVLRFRKAAACLGLPGRRLQFIHAGVSEESAGFLSAVIRKHILSRVLEDNVDVHAVGCTEILGGRTGAQLFIIKAGPRYVPFVLKVGDKAELTEEMRRYALFIQPGTGEAHPILYIDGDRAAIAISLVEDPDRLDQPAETLEAKLDELASHERRGNRCVRGFENDLLAMMDRIGAKIKQLQQRELPANPPASRNWLDISPIENLGQTGGRFQFLLGDAALDIEDLCRRANHQCEKLRNRVLTHGDMHCRNVLVVGGTVPSLIDYGQASGGHPCFDFVRIATAILCGHMHMLLAEQSLSEALNDIIIEGIEYDDVLKKWPAVAGSASNRVAIKMFVDCRRDAIRAAKTNGGGLGDYLAVQLIVGAQSLLIPQLQSSIARAIVASISRHVSHHSEVWPA